MSITDPIYAWYYERRKSWIIRQGNETFYTEENIMREWGTKDEALGWARENLNKELIDEDFGNE